MRKLVPILLLLVLGVVGAALFMVLSDDGGGSSGGGDVAPGVDENADDGTSTKRNTPDEPSRRWVVKGPGRVTGTVLEYGTDRPIGGVSVSLGAGLPGPNEIIETTTNTDGSFVIDDAINFDQWTLRVAAKAPLGELEMAGIEVVEGQETNVGIVYVTPSFEVPGIVVDERGEPVAGASVRALRQRETGATNDFLRLIRELPQRPPSVDAATTDAEGHFALTKIPAGRFDFELSGPSHALRIERGIVVSPETVDRPLRFVLVRGYELAGRVVRPAGGSVEGIQVVAFEQPRGEAGLFKIDKRFATTDETGAFTLRNLSAGEFVVAAVPEGRPFTINDDITIPGTDYVEIVLEGDAWLEGQVTDAAGQPVPEAEIYLVSEDNGNPSVGNAVAGADGRYKIEGLKSGPTQFFIVQATGFASYPDDLMSVFRGRGRSGLTLEPGANEQDVTLKEGATLSGIVLEQGTEAPVPGAHVSLLSPASLFGGGRTATTGPDGRFMLSGLPMGPAVVMAEKEGYFQPGVTQQSVGMIIMGAMNRNGGEAPKDTGRGVSISVTEPGEALERELKLAKGSTIRGIVTTPDGEPVPGAEVSLKSNEGRGMLGGLMNMMGSSEPRLTAANGTFSIAGPPPGQKMSVVAATRGWLEGSSEPISAAPGEVVEGLTIALRNGATLSGTVKDAQGAPIDGALVRWVAQPEDGNQWSTRWQLRSADPAVTAEDGTFTIAQVEPGKIIVQVTHTQYPSASQSSVQAVEGKGLTLDFALEGGIRLAGRVVRPDGSPASGARVNLNREGGWDATSDPYRTAPNVPNAGADGRFVVEGVPSGSFTLSARQEGFAPSADVSWSPGDAEITLRLEPAFRIAGIVRFNDGRPAASIRVQANRIDKNPDGAVMGSNQVGNTTTSDTGAFTIENLPAGEYNIDVGQAWWGGNDGGSVVPRTIEGVSAGTEGLQIEVTSGLAISGKVTMPDGSVAGQGWLTATRVREPGMDGSDNLQRNAILQDDGTFRIEGLKPGKYQVTVRVEGVAGRALEAAAGTEGLEIRLTEGGEVEGSVTGPTGSPLPNVNVWVNGPGGSANGTTDENGRFRIRGIGGGTYTVQAWAQADGKTLIGRVENVEITEGGSVNGIAVQVAEQN